MADNVPITAGSGTSIATDDVATVHFQKVKLDVGGDGATDPVSAASPLTGRVPVAVPARTATDTLTMTAANDAATFDPDGVGQVMFTISGTWTGTISFEWQDEATLWHPYSPYHFGQGTDLSAGLNQVQNTTTVNGAWKCAFAAAVKSLRCRVSTTGTGTATVAFRGAASSPDQVAVLGILGDLPDNTADPNVAHPGGYPTFIGGRAFIRSGETPETLTTLDTPVGASLRRALLGMSPWREARVTQSDKLREGSITANGQSIVCPLEGCPGVGIRISGTWTGTLQFEGSADGTNFDFVVATNTANLDGLLITSIADTASGVAKRYAIFLHGGLRFVRVRSSAWTSGTATIVISATVAGPDYANRLVVGNAAHDAADSAGPIKIGGKAESTRPTTVADADRVNAWLDTIGRQVVSIGSSEDAFVAAEYTTDQTDTSLIAAPAANLRIVIYDIVIAAGSAGTVLLESGTATRLFGRISLAANGGWSFNSAKGFKLAAATALTITSTGTINPLAVTVNYAIEQSLGTAGVA